ncbi:OpgC domain-containing protein [Pseudaminobacter sp. 19-2017]|uniref:OpgC domain-containing protein n=1 Tax=Pseudaminobacter soli (ex Zhang et al. 2022) TaxID=2831468 RepID=A0A942DVT5_9HYPH|nr:OpgC domain-containing protein [Pseudaminobacter soli]MBS3647728.1 OpgC domain-containing protein [Pseudaminobacter soli]
MNKDVVPGRDTRIDVFRALALLTIFVNHVPGTVFEHLTHKNFGFSDSAEAFVLISGIAVGLAYGTKFAPGNRLLLTLKAWRRAGVLYVAHIVTSLVTLAIFSAGALWFARPKLLEMINIPALMEDTPQALIGLVTLGHQVGYNNILSMYAVVLIMLPLFLLIGSTSLLSMVVASGLVWLAAGLWQIAPPNYPGDGLWFLNPLSWQFLFVIGMACLMHVRRGGEIAYSKPLALMSLGYVLVSLVWVRWPLWGLETALDLPAVLSGFDKTFLSLPRLLHVLALAYLIVSIPALSKLARKQASHPLAILGKHSLPVFIGGTLLSMAAQVLKAVHPGGLLLDFALIIGGIGLQFALAYWLEWLPTIGWGGKKSALPPRPAHNATGSSADSTRPALRPVS